MFSDMTFVVFFPPLLSQLHLVEIALIDSLCHCRAPRASMSGDSALLQVWKHELMREFSDKLITDGDRSKLFDAFCDAVKECINFPKPSAPGVPGE